MGGKKRKIFTHTTTDLGTGEVLSQSVKTVEQIREERFIMMKTHNVEWVKVFERAGPKSIYVLMFLVARGFVEFSTGIVNFTTWQRDQIRGAGLAMDDRALWERMRELVGCGVLVKVNSSTYRVSQMFFHYGKATKWVEVTERKRTWSGGGGVTAAGGDRPGGEEGGDVPVSGSVGEDE